MSTQPPLTEAERAVLQHMAENYPAEWCDEESCQDCPPAVRAVVAAVRPIVAEETLRQTAHYLYEHRRDSDGAYDLWRMYEAGGPEWLSSRATAARQSTARPTSKETDR